jgi:hypothetical protein
VPLHHSGNPLAQHLHGSNIHLIRGQPHHTPFAAMANGPGIDYLNCFVGGLVAFSAKSGEGFLFSDLLRNSSRAMADDREILGLS